MNLNGISILFLYYFYALSTDFCTVFRQPKAIFLQFYTVFAFLHPIFDVFSQYMRAIAFLLLWYFNTIFKVFLLYLQIRVFY